MAHQVMPSDNPLDFPSRYRYIMNGGELSGIGSVGLVPLTARLWSLSAEDFAVTTVGGNLMKVNASNATALPAYTIPYISCDEPNVMEAITDSFNSTDLGNVVVAVLYSQLHTHCNISEELAASSWLNLLTVADTKQAQQTAALGVGDDSLKSVQITADPSSLPPGVPAKPPRKGSSIPMIILYALTSLITALLLLVIIGGAIKARRQPERYGPRAIVGRPRQSRAKGIAMAILETLPIVKFGDPDPKQAKSVDPEVDTEMTAATQGQAGIDEESKLERPSKEGIRGAPKLTTDTNNPLGTGMITDQTSVSNPAVSTKNTDSTSAAGAQASDQPKDAPETLGCSICTEDFALGEELRVLPCNHKFHPFCVDPWLLNVSGTCPLCRIDLHPPQEAPDENEEPVRPPVPRSRSTMGGLMRGSRALDLQAILEASREERIRILRRWRQERQRGPEPSVDGVANANANTDADRTSSTVLDNMFREGIFVRQSRRTRSTGHRHSSLAFNERPRTWYAGEAGARSRPIAVPGGPDTPTQQHPLPALPRQSPSPMSLLRRARSWYGHGQARAGAPTNRGSAALGSVSGAAAPNER